MANYELSNIAWKGNTYTVKDNSALHQSAIGSWTPDFANLKPLATYEYDISSTSYFKICERPNVTSIKDIADEVLAFRITVTGTNIFSIADVIARFQPTVDQRPLVTVNHQTQSTSAGTTGIRYLRTVNPKAANTSYKYEIAIAAYNTTRRHIKVEVFKTASDWTFSSAASVYSYNSTYQTANDLSLYTNVGILYNSPFYATATYANYAGYKLTWDGLFNGQGSFLAAGAAIAANQFVFIGKDNKVYPTTSTSVEIDPAWPIVYCATAYAVNAVVTWSAIRSWGYFTPASSILKDGTLVADDTVYMRCTYTSGKLYSANTMTQTLTAGNTYIKLGKMYTATAVTVNTYNSEYFTLDTDGHIKALNGYLFNAAKADTANAVNRQFYIANANDYPILFDSNPTSDIATATTIPSVTPALKYNPSTGNLTSGLFTGSGAGLTDIPLDAIKGDNPVENTDVFISRTSPFGENKYKSAKLVGGTVAFNQISIVPFAQTLSGITFTRDSDLKTSTISGTATATVYKQFSDAPSTIINHIYYASLGNKDASDLVWLYNDSGGVNTQNTTNGETVGKATAAKKFYYRIANGTAFSSAITLTPQIIDLTLMFGSSIAERIYAMETATAGAGVAWFKKYFPKDYYPYDTGTLVSVCPTGMASGDVSYKVSPLELNGFPSLDSNDNLVYSGDIRESNGTVTRKFRKIPITYFNGAFGATSNGYAVYRNDFGIERTTWNFLCNRFSANYNAYGTMPEMTWIGGSGAAVTFTFILPSTVTSLAEANAWLESNPTSVMIPVVSEFTESTYPFKSPQLVYSGETESFIDDRDVSVPVGQIAEYIDNLDAVEDAALADAGAFELFSNKTTTVDSTSTDTQYPSTKAVYTAVTDVESKIPSKVDYSNTPFTGTCSTAAGTLAKTVTVGSSFQLVDGVRVRVYMEKANTNSAPTLNVNGTGAKPIGIQNPYGAISNVALSAWHSGAFARNGWFDFVYAASYDSGKGRWIIEDSPAPIRLANFVASSANRVTTINSTNGTLVNGGVRYTVVANGATGNPFSGSAAVLWLNHDNTATYTRQIAMSANTPPHMAFRSQDSGGGTNWQPWEYVLTAANQYDSHMATLAYTAAGIDFTTGAVTIPINGTQYKLIQLTIFNNDISKVLGYPSLFLFNASGSTGYKEGTSTYCTASSTSSSISVTFDSSWNMIGSTSIDITALYRRIS